MGERDNHIATVEPSAPTKDYSRRIMGGSNGDKDGSGTLSGLGIAPGAIFIAVAASHDAPGVVLRRGWGLYCSYVAISLSHGVIFMR